MMALTQSIVGACLSSMSEIAGLKYRQGRSNVLNEASGDVFV